ncbi:helicase C-terminal domain-containing protein [Achromobacter pulmonis]|uniref:helicase C-terminal domain-containing protein n=1 Tax=Achromobacter pulmonis TaxID=1389932 RepID=UPI003C73D538
MPLNFDKLKAGNANKKQTDPRRIFTTLKRDPRFKRPSDEQGDVLDGWFAKRDQSSVTLKMNTGSGKTVVGLLCLQSSLNEGKGPGVYVVPDNFLVSQVLSEANALGLSVTDDHTNAAFLAGDAILVINIWKLVNGRSVFGVGKEGTKIRIGTIVVDDAHACLATVADQFKIKLESAHEAYGELFALFEDDLNQQSRSTLLDVKAHDPTAIMSVPFWAWKDKQNKVAPILHAHRQDDSLKWPWPLVHDVLPFCQAAFGGGSVEIAPRFLPIDNIPAFTEAERRIYMTATLADDGILVSHFQANPEDIRQPIRPKSGGDIGDRMILAPQEINPKITINEIKAFAAQKSESINVSVIVPSKERAKFWADVADQTLTAENIEAGTEKLRNGHVGLTVFVNKYDGVDLPGQACELLIIDGLPEVEGLIARFENVVLNETRRLLIRQIQRIEQGMGRGVRSSEDHCVVLLIGSRLTQRVHNPASRMIFSPATRAQLKLGRQVTEQVKDQPLAALEEVIDLCLNQDEDWVSTSKDAIVNADEAEEAHIDNATVLLREAFDAARLGRFDRSQELAQNAVDATTENRAKGYVKQQLAEYIHHTNPADAQQLQLSAVELNRNLVRPIQGITYSKLQSPANSQSVAAAAFMKSFLEKNELILWVNALVEALEWGEKNTKRFERAMRDLGSFLGFGSQMPEEDFGKGPDNLWSVGNLRYFVIECKSGATQAKAINKHDCNQLTGSMTWFGKQYDKSCSATPIMVHKKTNPEHAATLHAEARILTEQKLDLLVERLKSYATAVGEDLGFTKPEVIAKQLNHFGLTAASFVEQFTQKGG